MDFTIVLGTLSECAEWNSIEDFISRCPHLVDLEISVGLLPNLQESILNSPLLIHHSSFPSPSLSRLDYVLALKIEDFLERRLQTQVYKSGLAKSIHHARVLIRQRHIRYVSLLN